MSESIIINSIIIIAGFTLSCVLLVLVIRSILELIIYFSYKNFQKISKSTNNFFTTSKKIFNKEDEELLRYKNENLYKIPKSNSKIKEEARASKASQDSAKKYNTINQEPDNQEEDGKIVGIVKPIGFWTSKIFGQRIATIMAQAESMKNGESTKFWQNFVKASRVGSQHNRSNSRN